MQTYFFLIRIVLCVILFLQNGADAFGCMKTICTNDVQNFQNQIRSCTPEGICGEYKSRKQNNQYLEAVELACNEDTDVYAPFDGEITYHQLFGAASNAHCADEGVRIDGTGQWRGYYALISIVKLYKYSGTVKAGEILGVAGNSECFESSSKSNGFQNYVRVELFRHGQPIDPTYHLIDCMCVGQLCESNSQNFIVGKPFKYESQYNGVQGWELECSLIIKENSKSTEDEEPILPQIFSPIEGSVLGRIRLNFQGGIYSGCSNDGLFIVGTGKWTDYEARLYNVRFRKDLGLGTMHIEQGQHIGYRLNCKDSPDSIFIEVRFQGTLVDISEAISAKSCQHKKLNQIF